MADKDQEQPSPQVPHRHSVAHIHFKPDSGYPESGWWCVICGKARVQGHPDLSETDLCIIQAIISTTPNSALKV